MTASRTDSAGPIHVLLGAMFFASGFAGLIYQVIWQRILTPVFGAHVYSVTIIVCAFMAGLGLGSLAGGHLADRLEWRGRFYALAGCELAVAVFAVFSTRIYYDGLYGWIGGSDLSHVALFAIIFALTLWPTFLMGMSLPLGVKIATNEARQPVRWVPVLYGWSTLGAACGSLTTVILLFRSMPFPASLRLAAGLNLACAVAAAAAPGLLKPHGRSTARIDDVGPLDFPGERSDPSVKLGFVAWVALYALSGYIALSLEVLWLRMIRVTTRSNSVTFGLVIAIYLTCVGLGAILARHRRVRRWPAAPMFLLLQAAIPAGAAISLALLLGTSAETSLAARVWTFLGSEEAMALSRFQRQLLRAALTLGLVGPASVLMGLSFGLLQYAVQTDLAVLGRRLGWLQAANIAGSVAGAAVTGLALLNWLGSAATLRVIVCCGVVFLVVYFRTQSRRASGWVLAGIVLSTLALIPRADDFWARLHATSADHVIHGEDGSGLVVLRDSATAGLTDVYVNGVMMSSLPHGGVHTALGALPVLLHPSPAVVAVIGLGSGDTLSAIGARSETHTIVSIEIVAPELPALRRLNARDTYPGLQLLLADTRVRHEFTGVRSYLRRSTQRFDVIEADALSPTSAYAGNLYSVEYFALLRDRLAPGGLGVTWVPTPRVIDSMVAAFPYVLVFDEIAIGSSSSVVWDRSVIEDRMRDPQVSAYFRARSVDIEDVLSKYLAEPPKLYGPEFNRRRLSNLNRDLFPKDEFAIP